MGSITMRISDNNNNDFMNGILKDVQVAEEATLQKCAKVIKARAEGNLRTIQKVWKNKDGTDKKRPREIHMAEDVIISRSKDKFGNKVVKICGGKQTGTLWHIVNDGTYRSKATHFMDKTINDTNSNVESIIDQKLGRHFE